MIAYHNAKKSVKKERKNGAKADNLYTQISGS